MKNIVIIFFIILGITSLNAQVGIEIQAVRGGGLMDFPANATKGILLPKVTNTALISASGTVGGAIAFNMAKKRVEYYNPLRATWFGMSETSTAAIPPNALNTVATNGVIVADGTGGTPPSGVLVLESSTKALILPQVPNAVLLPNPQPGTICYDMASKSIAVYNGNEWSFWN